MVNAPILWNKKILTLYLILFFISKEGRQVCYNLEVSHITFNYRSKYSTEKISPVSMYILHQSVITRSCWNYQFMLTWSWKIHIYYLLKQTTGMTHLRNKRSRNKLSSSLQLCIVYGIYKTCRTITLVQGYLSMLMLKKK